VTGFISNRQATRLRQLARPFVGRHELGKAWHQRTGDELWRRVLSQIAVVGRAEPGHRVQHDPLIAEQVSINRLKKLSTEVRIAKHLHDVFVRIGVRFAGKSWQADRKARAAARNFLRLRDAGGPKCFFSTISKEETEGARIQALRDKFEYYGMKGCRDILIELRLAKNCMALDVRIYGILDSVGVRVSPDDVYRQVEIELVNKVARPLGLSGGQLDRILFNDYKAITEASSLSDKRSKPNRKLVRS
jgi:hypothetical protein